MKIQGTKQEVFENFTEWLEKQDEDKTIHLVYSLKETKEMILHTQKKFLRGLVSEIGKFMSESPERVKQIFLIGCFGTDELTMGKFTTQVAKKPTTSELTKQETIFYIDTIWKFITDKNIPCKYTHREV